jgi:hypothetical protein
MTIEYILIKLQQSDMFIYDYRVYPNKTTSVLVAIPQDASYCPFHDQNLVSKLGRRRIRRYSRP